MSVAFTINVKFEYFEGKLVFRIIKKKKKIYGNATKILIGLDLLLVIKIL